MAKKRLTKSGDLVWYKSFHAGSLMRDWGKPIDQPEITFKLGANHTKTFVSRTVASPQEILVDPTLRDCPGAPSISVEGLCSRKPRVGPWLQ